MRFNLALGVISIAVALSACGGGGGSSSSSSSGSTPATPATPASSTVPTVSTPTYTVPTDAQIISDLQISQSTQSSVAIFDTSGTYGALGNPYKGNVDGIHSYRWNIERDGLIPVVDTSGQTEVTTALNNLEAAVGKTLFTRLPSTTDLTTLNRGLIINNATPPVQGSGQENNCGEVYANRQNLFSLWVDPTTYSIDPPLSAAWQAAVNKSQLVNPRATFNVDVDFNNAACGSMEPLVEHELVHALGLSNHFDGFGEGSGGNCNGAICTDRTYPVLKTLYANPPMTTITSMTIAR